MTALLTSKFVLRTIEDSLGATHIGGEIMIIDTNAALKLINKYFPQ